MSKAKRFMVGTMDNSIPAHCVDADCKDAMGIDWADSIPEDREAEAIEIAFDIAARLYGAENGDAFAA